MHDERSRCDRAEQPRCERHVVVTCGKRSCHIIKLQDLLIAMNMATPQHVAVGIEQALKGFSGELRRRTAERLRKIRRCTYETMAATRSGCMVAT
jgi:hypothetical protein